MLTLVVSIVLLALSGAPALRAMSLRRLQQRRLSLCRLCIFVTLLASMTWLVEFPHVGGLR